MFSWVSRMGAYCLRSSIPPVRVLKDWDTALTGSLPGSTAMVTPWSFVVLFYIQDHQSYSPVLTLFQREHGGKSTDVLGVDCWTLWESIPIQRSILLALHILLPSEMNDQIILLNRWYIIFFFPVINIVWAAFHCPNFPAQMLLTFILQLTLPAWTCTTGTECKTSARA